LKQLHIGVPHRFAVVIGDDAFDGCVRNQTEYRARYPWALAVSEYFPEGRAGKAKRPSARVSMVCDVWRFSVALMDTVTPDSGCPDTELTTIPAMG
jgi:hypothetical protein